jgi:hypothetical protein
VTTCPNPFPKRDPMLAFDPAVRRAGAAAFVDGVVVAASSFDATCWEHLSHGERASRVADMVFDWWSRLGIGAPRAVVAEWQRVYPGSRVNANDLLKLAACSGAVVDRARSVGSWVTSHNVLVLTPDPPEWVGNLPKCKRGSYWKSPRGVRLHSRLTPAERTVVPDQPDAGDATALGKWSIGEFAPINVRLR